MKKILFSLIFMLVSLYTFAVNQQITVKVDGIGCPFCAMGLQKKFEKVEGVKNIEIDLKTGLLSFEIDDSFGFNANKIAMKVKEAGYKPTEISINGKVSPFTLKKK